MRAESTVSIIFDSTCFLPSGFLLDDFLVTTVFFTGFAAGFAGAFFLLDDTRGLGAFVAETFSVFVLFVFGFVLAASAPADGGAFAVVIVFLEDTGVLLLLAAFAIFFAEVTFLGFEPLRPPFFPPRCLDALAILSSQREQQLWWRTV